MSEQNENTVGEYIQFSKRVTRWGMILVSLGLLFCLAAVSFCNLSQPGVNIIGKIYGSYITIMGITIGAYQGNSSLEKWTKAKYQYTEAVKDNESQPDEQKK